MTLKKEFLSRFFNTAKTFFADVGGFGVQCQVFQISNVFGGVDGFESIFDGLNDRFDSSRRAPMVRNRNGVWELSDCF